MDGESSSKTQSQTGLRSESKVLVGQKRGSVAVEETSENSSKRVKMRDLESVFRSEAEAGRGGSSPAQLEVCSDSRVLDLNVGVSSINSMVGDDDPTCVDESNNEKKDMQRDDGLTRARGFDLDLNAADISCSINEPLHRHKMNDRLKYRDESDCGSSVFPLVKDPMSVWKGLKQNNFMSTPRAAVPMAIPKARGRKKSNHDVMMKKKIELAKKEQVDRFARVAAPSGLLNGLNPGIINHVRNSKQVHSIIEALVRSERTENMLSRSKKHGQSKSGVHEFTERNGPEDMRSSRANTKETVDHSSLSKYVHPSNEFAKGNSDICMGYLRNFSMVPSQCEKENGDYKLPLKFSSSVTIASQNASCLSNNESENLSSVTSLSLKAANVASQWLELLNQDIRGRLAALRRSRKRVRGVIATELPNLISTELSSNIDKDLHTLKSSNLCHFDQATADAHIVKWNTLFAQMDKALSEEESHLDNWLNQVKEMQLHCELGLNKNTLYHSSLPMASTGDDSRSGATNSSEKDVAVRAAAASIYSTCNFLLSRENLPCC